MTTQDLLSEIDLAKSHLKPYEGFIFLCGGPTDVTSAQPISIRDAIYRGLVAHDSVQHRIRLAEHYKDWAHDSVYRDLVSFERHLAELSSVIVLVLESPGSLTELGLFSIVEAFQDKLLVFIETEHYQSSSFIRLGPVDYLEKFLANNAECHRWNIPDSNPERLDPSVAEDLQEDLADSVLARAEKPLPRRAFDVESWLHIALLICDLIDLYSALTSREISTHLKQLGIDASESRIRQVLFLLEKVELIAMEPKGGQRFYISIDPRQHVQFHLHAKSIDLSRFRTDKLLGYKQTDKKRFRAIQEARRRHV